MFSTDRPGAPGTGTGVLRSSMPSISSRFDAASVLTSSTFLPASASVSAAAVDSEVLPTPPLPVKNRCRVGWFRNPMGPGFSQVCTSSCEGMPPLCTSLPSIMTAGVALTPARLISSGFSTLMISTSTPEACAARSMTPMVLRHLLQPDPRTLISIWMTSTWIRCRRGPTLFRHRVTGPCARHSSRGRGDSLHAEAGRENSSKAARALAAYINEGPPPM